MQRVDLVTTTTEFFADAIRRLGIENVEVLPNCIDPLDPQFHDTTPTDSSLVRFGWIGGVHHRPDLEILRGTFSGFAKNRKAMVGMQFVLGGFNPNREYLHIEKLITANYGLFRQDRGYIDYLLKYAEENPHYSLNKPYRRLWALPVTQYARMYNEIDVALIPLRSDKFSACKSELKLIEAGWFKKAVICSDTLPYNSVIKDDENGLLVKGGYWSTEMKYMMDEGYRKEQGEALHETVRERFDIDKWSKNRYELYKKLI
jgi:glycosyltransferase involved in cell wall biosynthesis